MKARTYKSNIVQKMMDDMAKDSWYIKLRRWWRLKLWVYRCLIFNREQ